MERKSHDGLIYYNNSRKLTGLYTANFERHGGIIMITKNMKIEIRTGLEARPIAVFVQKASQYDSSIYVEYNNKRVNAKSIMGMMTLGLPVGEEVKISADGNDEEEAINEIENFLSKAE